MDKMVKKENEMKKKALFIILILVISILVVGIGFLYSPAMENKKVSEDVINKFKNAKRGAVETVLLFADEKRIIFYDRPALMVYDIVNRKFIRTVGFEKLGVKYFQGDDAYSIHASKKGDKISFEKARQMNRFVYDVEKSSILKNTKNENELFKKETHFNDYIKGVESDTDKFVPISEIVKVNNEQYVYLANPSQSLLGLEIVIMKNKEKKIIPIFIK